MPEGNMILEIVLKILYMYMKKWENREFHKKEKILYMNLKKWEKRRIS
jgi:glycopeptide antibiotics resistance protein